MVFLIRTVFFFFFFFKRSKEGEIPGPWVKAEGL